MTILLKGVPYDEIDSLDLKAYDAALRKRLSRNGLNDVPVIGGYEIIYRAKSKTWVLHINLVIIGGTIEAIDQFKATFSGFDIEKPVLIEKLKLDDPPTQLSYILKFTTYHRPFKQEVRKKARPYPLIPENIAHWLDGWRNGSFRISCFCSTPAERGHHRIRPSSRLMFFPAGVLLRAPISFRPCPGPQIFDVQQRNADHPSRQNLRLIVLWPPSFVCTVWRRRPSQLSTSRSRLLDRNTHSLYGWRNNPERNQTRAL